MSGSAIEDNIIRLLGRDLEEKLATVEDLVKKFKKREIEYNSVIQGLEKQLVEATESKASDIADIEELRAEAAAAAEQHAALQTELEITTRDLDEMRALMETIEAKRQTLERELATSTAEKGELQKQLKDMTDLLATAETKVVELEKDIFAIVDERDGAIKALSELEKMILELQAANKQQREESTQVVTNLQTENEKYSNLVTELRTELEANETQRTELRREIEALKAERDAALGEIQSEIDREKKKVDELNQIAQDVFGQLDKLVDNIIAIAKSKV
jgi:chromosome segregation ATPase